jgi:phage gp46-like protein
MADLSFIFDKDKNHSDVQIVGGDFLLSDELQTAVELSIFSDRRASTDEAQRMQLGQDRLSRRGYWANGFRKVEQGSGLWLLQREKRTQETLSKAKTFCEEALGWMTRGGIAQSVTVDTSFSGSALIINIQLIKPDGQSSGFKFDFAWDGLGE